MSRDEGHGMIHTVQTLKVGPDKQKSRRANFCCSHGVNRKKIGFVQLYSYEAKERNQFTRSVDYVRKQA